MDRHDEGNKNNIHRWSHPPPLTGIRSKFHDDDTFMNVSINLLARHDALNLTAAESIRSMFVTLDDQLAYYEALCINTAHKIAP